MLREYRIGGSVACLLSLSKSIAGTQIIARKPHCGAVYLLLLSALAGLLNVSCCLLNV